MESVPVESVMSFEPDNVNCDPPQVTLPVIDMAFALLFVIVLPAVKVTASTSITAVAEARVPPPPGAAMVTLTREV